jgi:NAD+ diphosphatase
MHISRRCRNCESWAAFAAQKVHWTFLPAFADAAQPLQNPMLSFTGNPLDRASAHRSDPDWLAAQRARADARFLPIWQTKPLLTGDRLGLLRSTELVEGSDRLCVFLGRKDGQPFFAVAMADSEEPPLQSLGEFREMRAAAFVLPDEETAIAGQAKALIDWHHRHRFCANCGTETAPADGGYRRDCPQCGSQHFPRTDPVVIMLPVLGEECLIGRNARFPGGLYSAFAGFLEPGETVEEAVRRELLEEVSLKVGHITYHASQHWPFPSSLMLGCYAQALSRDFTIDEQEIADARWLTKAEARARLAKDFEDGVKLPTTIAIARVLIADWVNAP